MKRRLRGSYLRNTRREIRGRKGGNGVGKSSYPAEVLREGIMHFMREGNRTNSSRSFALTNFTTFRAYTRELLGRFSRRASLREIPALGDALNSASTRVLGVRGFPGPTANFFSIGQSLIGGKSLSHYGCVKIERLRPGPFACKLVFTSLDRKTLVYHA